MRFLVKNKQLFIWLIIILPAFICAIYYIRLCNFKSPSKNSDKSSLNTSGLLSFEEFIASQNEDEFKIFPDDTCQPKRNVLFIKGHDSNSSSVQNLFFHYGDRDDLAIILVDMEEYYEELKKTHSPKRSLPLNPNHHSETLFSTRTDIPIAAVKQNYEKMKSILPADTIFLTDLTDSVSLTDLYFQKTRSLGLNQDKSLLLEQLEIFLVDPSSSSTFGFQQNLMSIELGFDKQHVNDQNQITQFIQTVDSQFHFVMIEEKIDEVLVHLHHLLCWPLDDLVIFRHRLRQSRSPHKISKELTEKMRSHNNVDELLYKHFNEKLTSETEKFGKRKMTQEINLMKQDIKSMYDKCITKLSQSKDYNLSNIVAHDYYTLRSKFEYHLTRQCYELIRWEVQLKMVSTGQV